MLLSIGMIVKNEKKYLRRCLEALKPILNSVKCELIIADTGSTDGTIEIAKEFTENVFRFDWCNDFATARNSVIKKAKGLWYMSIDADEILEDPKDIILFFNSGEYKKFKSAAYIIRSANDSELELSSELNATRLVMLSSSTRYVNAVHEQFEYISGPTKFFTTIANHYGYITEENENYVKQKINRNLKIMFDELEKKPSDCSIYLHISNAYGTLKDYNRALEYGEKGLTCAKERSSSLLHTFYFNIASFNYQLCNYSKVITVSDEYFQSKKNKLGTDLEIYMLRAESCFQLKMLNEAIVSFKEYLRFFKEFKQGLHKTADTFQHSISYTNEYTFRYAILRLVKSLLAVNDMKSADSYLKSIPYNDFLEDKYNISLWVELQLEFMEVRKDYSDIRKLYAKLDKKASSQMQEHIESLIDKDRRAIVLEQFSNSDLTKGDYPGLMRLRYEYYSGNISEENVREFLSKADMSLSCFADAAYLAIKAGIPIEYIASLIDSTDVGDYFYKNAYHHFEDAAYTAYEMYIDRIDAADTQTKLWLSALFFNELTLGGANDEKTIELFIAFIKLSQASLTVIFKAEILKDENAYHMPKYYRACYYCYMAAESLDSGQKDEYIKYLSMVSRLESKLGNIIKLYSDHHS